MAGGHGTIGGHKSGTDALFESVRPGDRLKLAARDVDDLAVLSTCVQDALAPLKDLAFLEDENRFVGALSRFRWETADHAEQTDQPYERVHSGIAFNKVRGVRVWGVDQSNRERFHSLLALHIGEGNGETTDGSGRQVITLVLAGGGAIELDVDEISVMLQDLGMPWPTRFLPDHAGALEEVLTRAAARGGET